MNHGTRQWALAVGLAGVALTAQVGLAEEAGTQTKSGGSTASRAIEAPSDEIPSCSDTNHAYLRILSEPATQLEGYRQETAVCRHCGSMRVSVYRYSYLTRPPARQESLASTFYYLPTAVPKLVAERAARGVQGLEQREAMVQAIR